MSSLVKAINLKINDKMYTVLNRESKKMGLRSATLVRLILDRALRDKSYLGIQIPEGLTGRQMVKKTVRRSSKTSAKDPHYVTVYEESYDEF